MARRWVVLTTARTNPTVAVNTIVEYTEHAGRTAAADEVIYTDPVDSNNDPEDDDWKVGGRVTLSGTTYTYTEIADEIVPHRRTTAAGRKRVAVLAASDQLDRWDAALSRQGRGQPSVIRNLGHDLILGQRKALYLRSVAAAATAAGVESYAAQIAQGASDITDVPTFFRLAATLTQGTWVDGDPVEWATLTGNAATRRTLQAAITAAPTDFRVAVRDFSTIDLGTDAWVRTAIT